jgi:hypothetical protein
MVMDRERARDETSDDLERDGVNAVVRTGSRWAGDPTTDHRVWDPDLLC